MNTIPGILQFLSALCIGAYAGAMLTEGGVLVPYWRSAPAQEFFSWYATNGARLHRFFGAVTWTAGLSAIAAALAAFPVRWPGRWSAALAAVLMILAAGTFFVYFKSANESFASGTLSATDLPAELSRWATWHWARTVLSIAALGAALLSVARCR